MLSSNQELQGKINNFIKRKKVQYPELSDTSSFIELRSYRK